MKYSILLLQKLASELQKILKEVEETQTVEIPVDVCEVLLRDLEVCKYAFGSQKFKTI